MSDKPKNPAAVALGRLGGKAKSDQKAKSSAENGKKGGRPKKNQNADGLGRRAMDARKHDR